MDITDNNTVLAPASADSPTPERSSGCCPSCIARERLEQYGIEDYLDDIRIELLVVADYADELRDRVTCALSSLSEDDDDVLPI